MRVLILGASGLLGKRLLVEWRGDELLSPSSRECDVRDRAQVDHVLRQARPQWTVLAAAYTDVDGCENDPQRAFDVNCQGASNVASSACAAGSKLLFLSTDYVFDGSKRTPYQTDDQVCPINVYGQSKADSEKNILRILPAACIVRTSWLFGAEGKCFPNTILNLARERKRISVVNDQVGCPTFNRDLSRAIIALVRRNAQGVIHATNVGACSWFEFAAELLRAAGSEAHASPVSSSEFPRPSKRPAYSVLAGRSLQDHGISLPSWREAISDYLTELKSNEGSTQSERSTGVVQSIEERN